jgi:enoyl-CoA hydratase
MSATIEIHGDVAVITMDDGKANAINPTMLASLNAALDQAEQQARAVVIVGREHRFSAGFDLKLMQNSTPQAVNELVKDGGKLALRLYDFPMPVVAACTGHGIAMGCFILLACDVRIGAAGPYKIGANETAINMVLPAFALALLKARLNPLFLTDSAINAALYDAEQAAVVGYLDSVTTPDNVLAASIERAQQLSALTSEAYAKNKHLIRQHTIDAIAPTVI